jgi:hypothetical protein
MLENFVKINQFPNLVKQQVGILIPQRWRKRGLQEIPE